MPANETGILLLTCPDRKGVVSAVSTFIYERGGNIVNADEHQDPELRLYFLRLEWDLTDFGSPLTTFSDQFAKVAAEFDMTWRVASSIYKPRVAIFVSKAGHCLADLLFRHQIGELACDIKMVISNHPDLQGLTQFYGIPYHEMHIDPANKEATERKQFDLLEAEDVDLVVLARTCRCCQTILWHDIQIA